MWRDLRYALRLLSRNPGFTLLAICTLGLALAAGSTVFKYADAAYLRSLSIERPGEIVHVYGKTKESARGGLSYPDYLDYRKESTAFADLAAYGLKGASLTIEGEAQMVVVQLVSGNYFPMLGVRPHRGRMLLPEDDNPAATQGVVVITHRLWQERFGARENILGQAIRVNDAQFTVAGVAPPHFRGLDRFSETSMWIPAQMRPLMLGGRGGELESRHQQWFNVAGRLKPGVTLDEAEAQLVTLAGRLEAAYPQSNRGRSATLLSEADRHAREALDDGSFLLAMVALVLLIACANVANLLLAHADGRRRDFAIRLAIGAGRRPLIRQLFAESLLLALGAAVVAVLFSAWLTSLLPMLMPADRLAIQSEFALDARLVLFCVAAALVCAAGFGLLPALQASRPDVVEALKTQTGVSAGEHRRLPIRSMLVVGQIAVSLVLLVAAALLLRSFLHSRALHPGFDVSRNIIYFRVVPAFRGYEGARLNVFSEELRRRLQGLPGVLHATYAARVPLDEIGGGRSSEFVIPGYQTEGADPLPIRYTMVGPGYFDTFGTRLLAGRAIDERDNLSGPKAAVINQTMARRFWPGEDPIGRSLVMGNRKVELRVVGVAEDSRINSLHEQPRPYLFVSMQQFQEGDMTVVIEAAGDPAAILSAAKAEVRGLESTLPIMEPTTLAHLMNRALYEDRMAACLVGGLGALGLFLGTVGLYGVVALTVARRTREVGIRLALGATRASVFAMVVTHGLRLALFGIAAGLAGSLAGTRFLASRLHGVSPLDPLTFAAVAALLAAVAALASYLPARRAAAVDPVEALRYE